MFSNPNLISETITAVRSVVGTSKVQLHEPKFAGREWEYLKECLDSTFVSSVGKFVQHFEAELAAYTGAKYAVAVVNGTAALHIALKLSGVKAEDEVLVPALTFVATANAISYCNAVPHFVESEECCLGIDPVALRSYLNFCTEQRDGLCINKKSGRVIRAIVPMHTFGHPALLDELLAIAHDFNLVMVEDAAESLGSYYRGKHTGTFGLLGALSFNGNKTITSGGGGAILTDNRELALRAKHWTTTAKVAHPWHYIHDEIGFNYRMPNLNAALGCAQLEQLPQFIEGKRALFDRYKEAFNSINGIKLQQEPVHCLSNYWLQTVLLDRNNAGQREALLEALNRTDYMSRPAWTLIHKLAPYKSCPSMSLKVSESLSARLINIPSSAALGMKASQ